MPIGHRARWRSSLAVRIAAGFVGSLVALLVAQSVLLFWVFDRTNSGALAPPRQLAQMVADRVAASAWADPATDVAALLRDQAGATGHSLVVVLGDGRAFSAGPPPRVSWPPPPAVIAHAAPTPQGSVFTMVVPSAAPQFQRAAVVALGASLVLLGSGASAWLLFRPVRARLAEMEDAAHRIGRGDLAARARTKGHDEVATLAHAFNRMAEGLAEADQRSRASDRVKRQLLADISHELRTPLTVIRGYLETIALTDSVRDAGTLQRQVQTVRSEVGRLERLVDDLLDLAVLSAPASPLLYDELPVESLFGREIARHEPDVRRRGIVMTARVDAGAELVSCDPHRLAQALHNLTSNAVRHTPDGGVIHLGARPVTGGIALAVSNSGDGIPAQHQARIFDRFYKVDASRQRGSGTGLGLSIVKAIVEAHGGSATVTSRPGEGATFTIWLPQEPPTTPARPDPSSVR